MPIHRPLKLYMDDDTARIDGAVAELRIDRDGIVYAEIRIPAPSPLIAPAGDVG